MKRTTCFSLYAVLLLIASLTPNIGMGEAVIGIRTEAGRQVKVFNFSYMSDPNLVVSKTEELKADDIIVDAGVETKYFELLSNFGRYQNCTYSCEKYLIIEGPINIYGGRKNKINISVEWLPWRNSVRLCEAIIDIPPALHEWEENAVTTFIIEPMSRCRRLKRIHICSRADLGRLVEIYEALSLESVESKPKRI